MGIYHSKLAISCALHRGDGVLHFNLYKTIIKINDFFFHTFKRVRASENSFSSSWLPKEICPSQIKFTNLFKLGNSATGTIVRPPPPSSKTFLRPLLR